MMNSYDGKRILVTGGSGFIGSRLVARLRELGSDVYAPTSKQLDLLVPRCATFFFQDIKPHICFHLAAKVGGIGYTSSNSLYLYEANAMMGVNVITAARSTNTRLVNASSACVYPDKCRRPFDEGDIYNGLPNREVLAYAIAKRNVMVFNPGVNLVLTGVYGPGEKIGDGEHVTGALARKLRGSDDVTLWGDGSQTRDFVYIDDVVEAFLIAGLYQGDYHTFNISGGKEITIRQLAMMIANESGYKGIIHWDATKPTGFKNRVLNTYLAEYELGWKAKTQLSDGITKLVEWVNGLD